jgi:hypothetical protein
VQPPLGVEHRAEPDQVLLVAPPAMVEDQETLGVGARRTFGEAERHRAQPSGRASYTRSSMAPKVLRTARLIPLARLLAAARVVMLAREHWHKLEPMERRRVITLVRVAGGRWGRLTPAERFELARLIAKADPRLFAGLVAQRFSPVPLPGRVVRGRRRA